MQVVQNLDTGCLWRVTTIYLIGCMTLETKSRETCTQESAKWACPSID